MTNYLTPYASWTPRKCNKVIFCPSLPNKFGNGIDGEVGFYQANRELQNNGASPWWPPMRSSRIARPTVKILMSELVDRSGTSADWTGVGIEAPLVAYQLYNTGDGTTASGMRFHHRNGKATNALFFDGHVEAVLIGQLTQAGSITGLTQ
jgi:prepilin-type processing-associated H-X9-DG protein